MNTLIVLSGEIKIDINKLIKSCNINYIVAVDGGYDHLKKQNIKPNILIGDLDSVKNNDFKGEVIKLNLNKSYTDYEYALKYVDEKFIKNEKYVVGFIAMDRVEHFYANLKKIKENITYVSSDTVIKLLVPGKYKINFSGFISFFSQEEVNLTLEGFKYNLDRYTLEPDDVKCISNELDDQAEGIVKFTKGKLLIFFSK